MPGVPPDAVDTLKRAFKGLFKRGKKSKQQEASPQEQTAPTTASAATAATSSTEPPNTTTSTAPPQLPPVQNASPLQSPAEDGLSKPLPPTQPIATAPQTQPQDAIPQNHVADPVAPSTAEALTTPQLESPATADGAKDDVGPSIQNSDPLAVPQTTTEHLNVTSANENAAIDTPAVPKTDSGIVAPKAEEQVVTDTLSKENTQPSTNGISTAAAPVQDEPPPIKAVQAAPGMSATSGPLEDFPEGGVVHEDEKTSSS